VIVVVDVEVVVVGFVVVVVDVAVLVVGGVLVVLVLVVGTVGSGIGVLVLVEAVLSLLFDAIRANATPSPTTSAISSTMIAFIPELMPPGGGCWPPMS
jgi:hypothetical protein